MSRTRCTDLYSKGADPRHARGGPHIARRVSEPTLWEGQWYLSKVWVSAWTNPHRCLGADVFGFGMLWVHPKINPPAGFKRFSAHSLDT